MIAFVFPGQGAQYVGMGQSIAARYPAAADLFARAGMVLGFDLLALCAAGPEERLRATENTQPAVLVTGLACAAALAAHGVRPDAVAGLSLGEYAALVSAGVMGFEDAVQLVRQRGLFMQEATAGRGGALAGGGGPGGGRRGGGRGGGWRAPAPPCRAPPPSPPNRCGRPRRSAACSCAR